MLPVDRLGMVRSIVTYMLLQFPRTRERGGGEGERKKKREKKKRAPLRKRRMLPHSPCTKMFFTLAWWCRVCCAHIANRLEPRVGTQL